MNLIVDPIFYLSIFLGLGGIYTLISSFDDDDDDRGDGEIISNNFNLARISN